MTLPQNCHFLLVALFELGCEMVSEQFGNILPTMIQQLADQIHSKLDGSLYLPFPIPTIPTLSFPSGFPKLPEISQQYILLGFAIGLGAQKIDQLGNLIICVMMVMCVDM